MTNFYKFILNFWISKANLTLNHCQYSDALENVLAFYQLKCPQISVACVTADFYTELLLFQKVNGNKNVDVLMNFLGVGKWGVFAKNNIHLTIMVNGMMVDLRRSKWWVPRPASLQTD